MIRSSYKIIGNDKTHVFHTGPLLSQYKCVSVIFLLVPSFRELVLSTQLVLHFLYFEHPQGLLLRLVLHHLQRLFIDKFFDGN